MIHLDPIIEAAAPDSIISLIPRQVYWTRGVYHSDVHLTGQTNVLKPKVQINGQDAFLFIDPPGAGNYTAILGREENGVYDLNFMGPLGPLPEDWNGKIDGIRVGVRSAVKRCRVARIRGSSSRDRECFGIAAGGGSEVLECQVSAVQGDYSSLFLIHGERTVARDCTAHGNKRRCFLFNFSNGDTLTYSDCRGTDGTRGFYSDTGDVSNVKILRCNIRSTAWMAHINTQRSTGSKGPNIRHVKNIMFEKNDFGIDMEGQGIVLDDTWTEFSNNPHPEGPGSSIDGVHLVDNRFHCPTPTVLTWLNAATQSPVVEPGRGIRGVNAVQNRFDESVVWRVRNLGNRAQMRVAWPLVLGPDARGQVLST